LPQANSDALIRQGCRFPAQPGRQEAGCNGSVSVAEQNSKLEIRMEADFQQRKG
jgi:hypothetical protein